MKLEDIMLSKISPSQKDKYRIIPLIQVRAVVKFMRRRQNGACQSLKEGEENGESLFNRMQFQFCKMKRFFGDGW